MLTKKSEKIRKDFVCKKCNYVTSDKKDYNKHILTSKHKNNTFVDISFTNLEKKFAFSFELPLNVLLVSLGLGILCKKGEFFLYFLDISSLNVKR